MLSMKNIATFCTIHLNKSQLQKLPQLVAEGYYMNYCDKENIILSKMKLTNYGFFVGAGAIIFNLKQEILLVQEKNGFMKGLWGFPSGLVNQKESLIDGMKREAFEETGLNISYRGIFYIRQVELTKWDRPDLYFGILADLRIDQEVKMCQKELQDYTWLKISQLKQFAENNRFTHASQFGINKLIEQQFAPISLRKKQFGEQMKIFYC